MSYMELEIYEVRHLISLKYIFNRLSNLHEDRGISLRRAKPGQTTLNVTRRNKDAFFPSLG